MQAPTPSAITTVAEFQAALQRHGLLTSDQLAQLTFANGVSPEQAAGELIQRGWLTPYQADSVFEGKGDELILGDFILLERIGQGGMGTIYKARHPDGHHVAIKILRPERLNNVEAVRRFYREVRIASKLEHPNVMPALAADQVGSRHFYVMEYLEGIDLDKLVRQRGPLPVPRALYYLKQVALGLQHAHEKGMVHRDIKPSNLFVTAAVAPIPGGTRGHDPPGTAPPPRDSSTGVRRGGLVKILDLGLARIDSGEGSTQVLTKQGLVMGSLDFIAPEQTLDSHQVDIRADLYSLGCTFYFVLTGEVPFPGGTASGKLVQHQKDEAKPLEELRPEVPDDVAEIIRKLMAKQPGQRFQTPGELAQAVDIILKELPVDEEVNESARGSSIDGDNSPTVWYRKSPTMPADVVQELAQQAAGARAEPSPPEPAPRVELKAEPAVDAPPPPRRWAALWLVVGLAALGILYLGWSSTR